MLFTDDRISINKLGITLSRIVKIDNVFDGKFQSLTSKLEESKISQLLE